MARTKSVQCHMPARDPNKLSPRAINSQLAAASDPLYSARSAVTSLLEDDAPHPVIDLLRAKISHIQEGVDFAARIKRAGWAAKQISTGLRITAPECEGVSDEDIKLLLYQTAFPQAVLTQEELIKIQSGDLEAVLSNILSSGERAKLFMNDYQFRTMEFVYVLGIAVSTAASSLAITPKDFNKSVEHGRKNIYDALSMYGLTQDAIQPALNKLKDRCASVALASRFDSTDAAIAFYFEERSAYGERNKEILREYLLDETPSPDLAKSYGFQDTGSISSLCKRVERDLGGLFNEVGLKCQDPKEALISYLGGEELRKKRLWLQSFRSFLEGKIQSLDSLPTLTIPAPLRAELSEALKTQELRLDLMDVLEIAPVEILDYGRGASLKMRGEKVHTVLLQRANAQDELQPLFAIIRQLQHASDPLNFELIKLASGMIPVNLTTALSTRTIRKAQKIKVDIKLFPEAKNDPSLWQFRTHLPRGYPFNSVSLKLRPAGGHRSVLLQIGLYEPGNKSEPFGSVVVVKRRDPKQKRIVLGIETNWTARDWVSSQQELYGRQLLAHLRGERLLLPPPISVPIRETEKSSSGYRGMVRVATIGGLDLKMKTIPKSTSSIQVATYPNQVNRERFLALYYETSNFSRDLPYAFLYHRPDHDPPYGELSLSEAVTSSPTLRTLALQQLGRIATKHGLNNEQAQLQTLISSQFPDEMLAFLLNETFWAKQRMQPAYGPDLHATFIQRALKDLRQEINTENFAYSVKEMRELSAENRKIDPQRLVWTLLTRPSSAQMITEPIAHEHQVPIAKAYALDPKLDKYLPPRLRGSIDQIAHKLFTTTLCTTHLEE